VGALGVCHHRAKCRNVVTKYGKRPTNRLLTFNHKLKIHNLLLTAIFYINIMQINTYWTKFYILLSKTKNYIFDCYAGKIYVFHLQTLQA
jgi:hypothetical protein